jgi:hypothetical protein
MPNFTTSVPYIKFAWDNVDITYPDTVTEVYTFSQSGNVVGVITLTYTDSTKANLSKVVKS